MSGNKSNKQFYNHVPLEVFKDMTKQGGFSDYKDLKLIADSIPSAAHVLELGAGYGRCIDFLLARNHTGLITAVEHSASLLTVLREKYIDFPQVEVVEEDLNTTVHVFKADVVLWIFSGLLDFSKEEQLTMLKKIQTWIKDGGKLFVDIPQLAQLTIARYTDKQDIVMDTPYGSIATFLPSETDMKEYGASAGFAHVDVLYYDTDTDKKRAMYIFSK
jgi:phospholipid N-methyltransferase